MDAYGFSGIQADGTGQTIAIVDAYGSPTITHDLNKFCLQFGIAAGKGTVDCPLYGRRGARLSQRVGHGDLTGC